MTTYRLLHPMDATGQYIYAGIDVHQKSWQVSVYTIDGEHHTFSQPPEARVLIRYLRRTFPGARYRVVYEAGFSGFWLQHALTEAGIEALVVHPPDIPTTDKERRTKRNKLDARKLARMLRAGALSPIYIPSAQALDDRALVRYYVQLIKKRTRVKNQIKSHLYFFGIRLPEDIGHRYWSRRFIAWLETMVRLAAGGQTLRYLLDELAHLRRLQLETLQAIRQLSRGARYRDHVLRLTGLSGIGMLTAMTLLVELVDINRFNSLDQLASFVGLTPTTRGSGDHEQEGTLTPRRSRHLRRILIESAWVAVRNDPVLHEAFERCCQRMRKNQAIVRIARKQLSRIRYVLKQQRPLMAAPST